jgi:two-component system nitrogen regulation response regulator NtrX
MKTILLVDDEPAARYALRRALESRYRVVEADSAATARTLCTGQEPDLLLLDVVMPDEDGLSFLKWLREQRSELPVLMISALDTAKTAVEALQLGASDYLVKGFELEELRQRVANLLKLSALERENEALKRRLITEGQFGQMIGNAAVMRRAFEMADRVAAADSTVLILGESGTGKDLLAQEIHARSPRAAKPCVAVNCAALPETLIESELFGYERGAFTGAMQQKKGRFEQAHGGSIFLDEIGDMNPVTQAKVLRVLENRTVERLGATQSFPVDVRVISATHRDLPAEIRAGRFREDLFYRLRVVTIELPPLRAHKEDIPLLAEAFLQMHGAKLRRGGLNEARAAASTPHLTHQALAALERYDWPGNVRELKNALERALVLARGDALDVADLPQEVASGSILTRPASQETSFGGVDLAEKDFRDAKRKFEVAYLTKQLSDHHWNVSRTAATIGLHRQSLQEKLRELAIRRPGRAPLEDDIGTE